MKLSVRNKMFISFGLIIILVFVFGLYSLNIMQGLRDNSNTIINTSFISMDNAYNIETHIAEYRGAEYRHLVFDDISVMKEVEMSAIPARTELK